LLSLNLIEIEFECAEGLVISQDRYLNKRLQNNILTKENPSVRVPRAETRLTVYCSALVDLARCERARVKLDVFFSSISVEVYEENVFVNIIPIFFTSTIRSKLANARHDKSKNNIYP
jgi:hypothetical protein